MHSSGSDSPVDDRPDSIEMDLVRGKGRNLSPRHVDAVQRILTV